MQEKVRSKSVGGSLPPGLHSVVSFSGKPLLQVNSLPLPDGPEVGVQGQHKMAEGVGGVAAADYGLLQQHHLHRLQPVLEQLQGRAKPI